MKKSLILLLLVTVPVLSYSQGIISFGPKVGWNQTKVTTDYQDYLDEMKDGAQAGVFFSINLNKLYLQPEAYFSMKRGLVETTIGDPLNISESLQVRQSFTLTTVDIPLLIGYRILDLKLARLRIYAGPVASYILNKEYELSINEEVSNERIARSDFKEATWGVLVGAGADLLFLTFDIGYEIGFEEFLNIRSLNNLGFTNHTFFVSMGWRIL